MPCHARCAMRRGIPGRHCPRVGLSAPRAHTERPARTLTLFTTNHALHRISNMLHAQTHLATCLTRPACARHTRKHPWPHFTPLCYPRLLVPPWSHDINPRLLHIASYRTGQSQPGQSASTNRAKQLALGRIESNGIDGSVAAQLLRTGTWLSREDQADACIRSRGRARVRARVDALRLSVPKSFRETR